MKKTTLLAALAMSLCAATSAHAEKFTDPQNELIVNLAVITASVDRCHLEIDSRIIGLDLLKELMLIEDPSPGARYHYNMPVFLRALAMRKEALRDDEMQIVLGAGHRDIQKAALLLDLGQVPVPRSDGMQPSTTRWRRSTGSTMHASLLRPANSFELQTR
jgi:hypothetical protein